METEQGKTIPVVFGESVTTQKLHTDQEATLGPRDVISRAGQFVRDVPVEHLQQSLRSMTESLATMLADLKAVGGFELSEVQVGVELTAEGGVNLIGSMSAGAKGALQLTFKPPANDARG